MKLFCLFFLVLPSFLPSLPVPARRGMATNGHICLQVALVRGGLLRFGSVLQRRQVCYRRLNEMRQVLKAMLH